MSKNLPTIEHLKIACRHVQELMAAGVSENLAIRTLELFSDCYAQAHSGGSITPHHVRKVPKSQWSMAAVELIERYPDAKPLDHLRVEHGTPRRHFARMVLNLYKRDTLTEADMAQLVAKSWKLAVITLEEDRKLNKTFRSTMFGSPDDRWKAAGILFSNNKVQN